MAVTRTGSAYQGALMTMLFLMVFSIAFGFLAYNKYDDAWASREGDPEAAGQDGRSVETCLNTRITELRKAENDLRDAEDQVAVRLSLKAQLDLHLSAQGVAYKQGGGFESFVRGGQDDKVEWERCKVRVQEIQKRVEAVRDAWLRRQKETAVESKLKGVIAGLREELNKKIQDGTKADDEFEAKKTALLEQLDKLDAQKKKNEEAYRKEFSAKATKKAQLDQQIRELLELRSRWLTALPDEEKNGTVIDLDPDGHVVTTGVDHNFVVIDIGSQDRVTRGLKLEAFRYVRGRFVSKGMVEVIDVKPTQSTCRIIEEIDRKNLPIADGDLVGNPAFDTKRPVQLVLGGEFRQFNKPDVAEFIARIGSSAQIAKKADEIQPGPDYLVVVGAGQEHRSDQYRDKAREYHITVMTEARLIRYLNTTFGRKAANAVDPVPAPPKAEVPKEEAPPAAPAKDAAAAK